MPMMAARLTNVFGGADLRGYALLSLANDSVDRSPAGPAPGLDGLGVGTWRVASSPGRLTAGVPFVDQHVEAHQVGERPVTQRFGPAVPADLDETVGEGNV